MESKDNNFKKEDLIVGTFEHSRNFGFVVPDDTRIKTDIFVSKKNINGAKDNQKVVVKITIPAKDGKKAEGVIEEIIGNIDEAGVDMLSLIKEYGIANDFPKDVLEEAENIPETIPEKELSYRVDLRNEEIFTIDGEDAKDLDDAVCVKINENGNYVLGVHIADVSHYVRDKSALDKEALQRGTSIYMMDRVIPMLPKKLSNGVCSLNQGVDRLAISCIMEIDKNGNVISNDVYQSVINVTRRMSYTEVKDIIENNKSPILEECSKYIKHFKLMEELAHILKNRRIKKGYLTLDIPESKIILDKNGRAIDVKKYETSFSNEIIEQFMLTANDTIAEKFFYLEAPFIYRVHEEPDYDKVQELNTFLKGLGYYVKATKDNIHPKAFQEVLNAVKGKPEEMVVSTLILRTLKVARYENENNGHFGIASKHYCHFTSPIRRYPDLFIHRVITKYLKHGYLLDEKKYEKFYHESAKYADMSSDAEKVAQKVERDSIEIKKAEYMQSKIGEIYSGIISSVTSFGVFVELENTVEGLIRFEDLGDEYFNYNEEKKQLIGERTNSIYKIGDKIQVQVIYADKITRRVNFKKYIDDETINK